MSFMSWLTGNFWWHLLPIRKKESIERYRMAFPDRRPSELKRSVGDMIMQYIRLLLGGRLTIKLPVDMDKNMKNGAVAVAGHGGAWDMALISLAEKIPVTIFLKEPTNPLAAKLIRSLRTKAGIEGLHGRDVMKKANAALDRGRLLIFVQDQRHNDGLKTKFFGREALTSAGLAVCAWKRDLPIFGIWQDTNVCTVELLEWEIPESRNQAVSLITRRSQEFYEEKIKEKPWSWLWLHRRWKMP